LHLLGVSVLLISTKYEEIYPPELRDLLAVSENKFTRDQVLTKEKEILNKLEFKITAPSAYRFLESYRRCAPIFEDKEVFFFA
jgi:cyclin B